MLWILQGTAFPLIWCIEIPRSIAMVQYSRAYGGSYIR